MLAWFWPLGAGIADASIRLAIKKNDINGLLLSGYGFLYSVPIYLIWCFFDGTIVILDKFWWALLLHVPCSVLIILFTIEGHRRGTLLKIMPYASFTPAFLIITSPIMGTGTPTLQGVLGILILVLGLYILNFESGHKDWIRPFVVITRDRGAQFMFGAALISSIAANLDRIAILNANSSVYLLLDHGSAGIVILILAFVFSRRGFLGLSQDSFRNLNSSANHYVLAWFGGLNAMTAILHVVGLRIMPHVPYFISVKRAGAILFSVCLGLGMYYWENFRKIPAERRRFAEEKEGLGWKLTGTLVVVVGMIISILKGGVYQ